MTPCLPLQGRKVRGVPRCPRCRVRPRWRTIDLPAGGKFAGVVCPRCWRAHGTVFCESARLHRTTTRLALLEWTIAAMLARPEWAARKVS